MQLQPHTYWHTSFYVASTDVFQLLQYRMREFSNNGLEHSNIETPKIGLFFVAIALVWWFCGVQWRRRWGRFDGFRLRLRRGGVFYEESALLDGPLVWVW